MSNPEPVTTADDVGRAEEGLLDVMDVESTDSDPNKIVLYEDNLHTSEIDVQRRLSDIQATRRMTDTDIKTYMHSANPKKHETVPPHAGEAGAAEEGVDMVDGVPFIPSTGLTEAEAAKLREQWGLNELEEKSKSKWVILWEQFSAPMPIMIWMAALVEAGLQNWLDMGVLLALQFLNGSVGFYETTKAGNAVAALKASLKPSAHCKRDGKWLSIHSNLLVPGDLVMLGSGSAVPADCVVNGGQIDVDQAALTGESMPVTMGKLDQPKMGSTVVRGEVEGTVLTTGMNTFFGKTASLIQSVDSLSHLQLVLIGIMKVLVAVSMILCGVTLIVLLVSGESAEESISFVVVILVASIPLAMEVVTTTTLALGSRQLAAKDAIVARLPAIEDMAGMSVLCSDKTGTLTLNKMVIQEDCPTFQPGVSRYDVIQAAALAAKWHEPPRDALDTMVLGIADIPACDDYVQLDYVPFDPALKRTQATLKEKATGNEFKVTKGAPHVVLDLCYNAESIHEAVDLKVMELAERGIRSLAVARTNAKGEWAMMGIMTFLDPPRPDTKATIHRAMAHGVDVKMITGDHQVVAKETARQLGMGTNILKTEGLPSLGPNGEVPADLGITLGPKVMACNGFSQVFPEHKFLIVEALRQMGYSVGMTGDGVNDAPALKKADVGVAVQGATDAARASADIILTSPGLSTVVDAIIISRQIFARMKNFIIYRVACTFQLLVFFFFSVIFMRPSRYEDDDDFPKFWSMPVTALILITVLNDGTIISIAYDNVLSRKTPEEWNMPSIYFVSLTLGMIACGSSLLCLDWGLASLDDGSVFSKLGLPGLSYGECVSMMYLKISLSDFLTLFAARSRKWFFDKAPGKLLMAAFCIAVGLSTIFSLTWPLGEGGKPVPGSVCGFVWIYCIIWFLIQDAIKVVAINQMQKNNWFNYNRVTSHIHSYPESHFNDSKHPSRKGNMLSNLSGHFSSHKKDKNKGDHTSSAIHDAANMEAGGAERGAAKNGEVMIL